MPLWFAVATPGLEPVTARELSTCPVTDLRVVTGGVEFEAPLEVGAELATLLRTPARLRLRLVRGPAHTLRDLARLLESVDWSLYLHGDTPVQVEVAVHRSRMARRDIVEKKADVVLRDVRRRLPVLRGRPPGAAQRLLIRLEDDIAEVSLDAGGELLHRRGWRQDATRAPLRENLAAAILVAAGWDGTEALVDPFCGSGTLPIEAALLASERAPWAGRSFAWESWPALSARRAHRPRGGPVSVPIVGADHDERAIAASTENARRAGVEALVSWQLVDVSDLAPPAPSGLVVANPPYGQRLGQRVRGVYVRFGQVLRARFGGWRVAFLAPNDRLAAATHTDAVRLTSFRNGGLSVGLFVIEEL